MHANKLRIGADENGFVPAGQYFKRLAQALREANEREVARTYAAPILRGRIDAPMRYEMQV